MSDISQPGDVGAMKPTEKADEKESFFERYAFKIIVAVVAALIGSALTVSWQLYANRLRTLRYSVVSSSGLIPKPNLQGKQLTVTIGDKRVDDLSAVSIYAVNQTGADFDDVPVNVIFARVDGRTPKLMQSPIAKTQSNVTEDGAPTEQQDGSLRFSYRLKVANRSATVFAYDYLFEGGTAPPATLEVFKKGLTAELVPIVSESKDNPISLSFAFVVGALMATICVGEFFHFPVSSAVDVTNKRRRARQRNESSKPLIKNWQRDKRTWKKRKCS